MIAAASVAFVADALQDSCYALALSGGQNNAAWEVGVLWGLINYGNHSDFAYDAVSGVDFGAMTAGWIAGWPKG